MFILLVNGCNTRTGYLKGTSYDNKKMVFDFIPEESWFSPLPLIILQSKSYFILLIHSLLKQYYDHSYKQGVVTFPIICLSLAEVPGENELRLYFLTRHNVFVMDV